MTRTTVPPVVLHISLQFCHSGKRAEIVRLAVEPGELGADLPGAGMMGGVIDGQCLLPGLPGVWQFASGMVRVAGVSEDLCFVAAVAVVPAQTEREFEMGGGPGQVAEVELDVTEGVPDVVLEIAAVEPRDEGQ
jgi:hypothetical protein